MKTRNLILGWAVATLTVLGTASWAQEVEPPFTWKGEGEASFVGEYEINEFNVTMELSVDASGGIRGKTSSDEGDSTIKHLFYGERVEHEIPGFYSRKAILVLMLNEDGSEPLLAILDGRLLAGRLFTAEVLLKRYEPGSESARALGVGSAMATQIDEDYLPSGLKSALKSSMPIGTVKVQGAYAN